MRSKVVIAPDGFKGSLTSPEVCEVIASEWLRFFPRDEVLGFPLADGGEGVVEALVRATGGSLRTEIVRDPLGAPVTAKWGILGDGRSAVVETAEASGLGLVEASSRDPGITSTFGTGEIIRAALKSGCSRLIIGLGGSGTNDGGSGMARALGVRFLDKEGSPLPEGGVALSRLHTIDASRLIPEALGAEIVAACDVDNPLYGPDGASVVYGPQKGATPERVRELDEALVHYACVVREQLGVDVAHIPGSGAAGGLGAGLVAFLGARLEPGSDLLIRYSGLEDALRAGDVNLVITGEGEMNSQTARGKTPWGVARLAGRYGIPVVAIVGSVSPDAHPVYERIDAVISTINRPLSREEAMGQAEGLLREATATLARLRRVFTRAT